TTSTASTRSRICRETVDVSLTTGSSTGIMRVRSRLCSGCLGALALMAATADACDRGSVSLFSCEAATRRKFIELCAPSPLDAQSGYLVYRFGSLDEDREEKAVELEYPAKRAGSLKRYYAATYTHKGIYTQSVRFVSGDFGYTVFTRAR